MCTRAEEIKKRSPFLCGAGLAGAFKEMEQLHKNTSGTDTSIEFNFDGVQALRAQIEQGAYADVLVLADLK